MIFFPILLSITFLLHFPISISQFRYSSTPGGAPFFFRGCSREIKELTVHPADPEASTEDAILADIEDEDKPIFIVEDYLVVDEYWHTVPLEQLERGGGVYLDGVLQPGAWFARPVRAAGLGQLKSWWVQDLDDCPIYGVETERAHIFKRCPVFFKRRSGKPNTRSSA